MSKERIDLTQFEGIGEWKVLEYWDEEEARYEIRTGRDNHSKHEAEVIAKLPNLIAELKKMYNREDELLSALRIIRDDLDEIIDKDIVLSLSSRLNMMRKIRNFANDASL